MKKKRHPQSRLPKRVRLARKAAKRREANFKKALGIQATDIVPHVVGRRPWLGFRDHAPEENGPLRVRRIDG